MGPWPEYQAAEGVHPLTLGWTIQRPRVCLPPWKSLRVIQPPSEENGCGQGQVRAIPGPCPLGLAFLFLDALRGEGHGPHSPLLASSWKTGPERSSNTPEGPQRSSGLFYLPVKAPECPQQGGQGQGGKALCAHRLAPGLPWAELGPGWRCCSGSCPTCWVRLGWPHSWAPGLWVPKEGSS